MKKILNIIFVMTISVYSSTRSDVKVIESSENIRYLGQKISQEYLYLYKNPKNIIIKNNLYSDIDKLEQNIIDIATITNNKNSKNILEFLAYNKDEIKTLLKTDVSKDKCLLFLDYSESFVEATNSIEQEHMYNFSIEEKMLMRLKNIEYLIERATKYYMAYSLDIDKINSISHMKKAIDSIDSQLKYINLYNYPQDIKDKLKELNIEWKNYREALLKVNKLSTFGLIIVSVDIIENKIKDISLYHKQNR